MDRKHYDRGWDDGEALAEHDARVLAFGAIRRAAAIARKEDARYALLVQGAFRGDKVAESLLDGSRLYAFGIRHAIRAAIGSDKS